MLNIKPIIANAIPLPLFLRVLFMPMLDNMMPIIDKKKPINNDCSKTDVVRHNAPASNANTKPNIAQTLNFLGFSIEVLIVVFWLIALPHAGHIIATSCNWFPHFLQKCIVIPFII